MSHAARWVLCIALLGSTVGNGLSQAPPDRARIFVVSSYHREYLWSQDTQRGLCDALLQLGYLDDERQAQHLARDDRVESSGAIVQKAWMDTKRRPGRDDIARATAQILQAIDAFGPDVVLLGDDNAANHIGNNLIDTDVPVVFWGINGLPLKYDLLDSLERPGHNVTGVYQQGYLEECVHYLKRLVPAARTIAVLADDSETGRSKAKELQWLASAGRLDLELTATVVTNSLALWKSEALRLQEEVDAFFVLNHNTIQDEHGRVVDPLEIGAWYLQNIRKPDCAHERQFALEGMLLTVDDSGHKQAFTAMAMADQILRGAGRPETMLVRAPERGAILLNRARAAMLGIDLAGVDFVEEFVDTALALRPRTAEAETSRR